jgi:hypothetical protein
MILSFIVEMRRAAMASPRANFISAVVGQL